MRTSRWLLALATLVLLVTGCASHQHTHDHVKASMMVAGDDTLGSLELLSEGGTSTPKLMESQLKQQLMEHHVNILHNGQSYNIIIPADEIFHPCTPRFISAEPIILRELADYFHYFNIVSMDINVYADNQESAERAYALTRAQAKKVQRFLWHHNIDVRVLSANGYGALYPIADNDEAEGRYSNRRIELVFRRLDR